MSVHPTCLVEDIARIGRIPKARVEEILRAAEKESLGAKHA